VLAAMGRGYAATDFTALAARAREQIEDLALGTDVLCGFPGEDAGAFAATRELLAAVAPAYVHAFPYSPRPGTRAADLPHDPPREVARARVRDLRELGDRAAAAFRRGQRGRVREVIVERVTADGAQGLTDNYLAVDLEGADHRVGDLVRVRLGAEGPTGRLRGEPLGREGSAARDLR